MNSDSVSGAAATARVSSGNGFLDRDWKSFVPVLTALIGIGAGYAMAGYTTTKSRLAEHRVDAMVDYAAYSWGGARDDYNDYIRKLSGLTVFAGREILESIAEYNSSGCAGKGDPTLECRLAWAKVVTGMRRAANSSDDIDPETIVKVLYGNRGTTSKD